MRVGVRAAATMRGRRAAEAGATGGGGLVSRIRRSGALRSAAGASTVERRGARAWGSRECCDVCKEPGWRTCWVCVHERGELGALGGRHAVGRRRGRRDAEVFDVGGAKDDRHVGYRAQAQPRRQDGRARQGDPRCRGCGHARASACPWQRRARAGSPEARSTHAPTGASDQSRPRRRRGGRN